MSFQATPYTLPLVVAGVAFTAVAVRLARRTDEPAPSVRWAIPLFAATAVWTLGYAGELTVTSLNAQLLFARIQYLGNAAAPLLWFGYVVAYVGYDDAVPSWVWAALAVPPVAVVALVATYPATELVWEGVSNATVHGVELLHTDHGPLFYAFMAYVYALVLAATLLLVARIRRSAGVYRRQTAALLAGSLTPAIAGVLYVAELSPFPALNLPALAFVVTGVVVAWSVHRSELFSLAPVAWETAISQLEDPVFVVNEDERLVAANDAGQSLAAADVGAPASEALGHVFDAPYWREPGDHECNWTDAGELRALAVSVTPVESDGGRAGTVLVVRDVTERHRREERLAEFASVVSHDLRNPLNVARGHLDLGRETGDDQHFEEVDDALGRMERIIEDLLTLAREGDAEPDTERVSLAEAARTAWGAVDKLDADATLDVTDDRSLVADETALLRLLENLFRNSVEHGSTSNQNAARSDDAVEHGSTSPGSQAHQDAVERGGDAVTVTVGATDDGFYVADDGPGIPDDERETVFEHGYTTSEDGTGFGLAIVEEIAATHGWTVSVGESEAGGARFDFEVA